MSTSSLFSNYRALPIRLPLYILKNRVMHFLKTPYIYIALLALIGIYIFKKHLLKLKKYCKEKWRDTGVLRKIKYFFIISGIILLLIKIKQFFNKKDNRRERDSALASDTSLELLNEDAEKGLDPSLALVSLLGAYAKDVICPTRMSRVSDEINSVQNRVNAAADNIAAIEYKITLLLKNEDLLTQPQNGVYREERLILSSKLTICSFVKKNRNGIARNNEVATIKLMRDTILPSVAYISEAADKDNEDPHKIEHLNKLAEQTERVFDLLSQISNNTPHY